MSAVIRAQAKSVYTEMPPRAWLLYGETKVGKTETAASFPKPLILNPKVEDRTSEIVGDVWDIPIGDTTQLKAAIEFLRSGKHEYKFVVLDAATAYIDDIISRQNESNPLRKTRAANDLLFPILTDFFALPLGKILTGHAKYDNEEIDKNNKKRLTHPDFSPSFQNFICARVTCYGYCYPAPDSSKVRWLPLESPKHAIAAGNALGLPAVTDLKYPAILHAIVKSKPVTTGQGGNQPDPLNGSRQKWNDFLRETKLTETTLQAALGVIKPSDWLAANTGKTIDDCINVVKKFMASLPPTTLKTQEKF